MSAKPIDLKSAKQEIPPGLMLSDTSMMRKPNFLNILADFLIILSGELPFIRLPNSLSRGGD